MADFHSAAGNLFVGESMNNEQRTVGLGLTWEKLSLGRKFRAVGRTITEADLLNFIVPTGMVEVLFTTFGPNGDEDIKGRLVPPAMSYFFAEGLLIQPTVQGVGLDLLDMKLKVKGPTLVGDTNYVEVEEIKCRQSKSPGTGLVRTRNSIVNQDGSVCIKYTPLRMLCGVGMLGGS
jgi:hypothetical protein